MKEGVEDEVVEKLTLLGITGIGNLLCAVNFAKYCELTSRDIVLTVVTDSMDLYRSRLAELNAALGRLPRTSIDISRAKPRPICASLPTTTGNKSTL